MTIPLPVLPDVYRVAFIWGLSPFSPTPVNVMHFKATNPGSHASDIAATLNRNVQALMWANQATGYGISTMSITPLDGTTATQQFPATGTKWVGSAGSGDFAPQVATLVKLTTGHRGRSNRGRVYLPFTAESVTTGGSITGSGVGFAQTAWTAFINSLASDGTLPSQLVVAAYDRAHAGAAAHTNPVTSVLVETFAATQRRRQPGRKVARH